MAQLCDVADFVSWAVDYNINDLPDDQLLKIFYFFSPQELCNTCGLVCRKWHQLVYTSSLWLQLELCLPDFHCCIAELNSVLKKVAAHLKYLTIRFNCKIDSDFFDVLPVLPTLAKLDLGFNVGIDLSLADFLVDRCPNVSHINVEGCKEVRYFSI